MSSAGIQYFRMTDTLFRMRRTRRCATAPLDGGRRTQEPRRCGARRPARAATEDPHLRRIVEQRVGHRRHEQRQQQRERLAAEDDEADRAVGAGADAARDDERDHAGDEREGGHQNRPQPIAAGLDDGVVRVHAGLPCSWFA